MAAVTALAAPASPWLTVPPLTGLDYERFRREAIFACRKWDAQVEDVASIAPAPLVLRAGAWRAIAADAELLFAEAMRAEAELVARPDLLRELALPRAFVRLLPRERRDARAVRVMRFDFHPCVDGWRISEVNSDVPGGFNEASGLGALFLARHPRLRPSGDPSAALAAAIAAAVPAGSAVALSHATSYSDDRQVMEFIGERLVGHGLRPLLAAPDHLRWRDGGCRLGSDAIAATLRFFPAEWLPSLPWRSRWRAEADSSIVRCNPLAALAIQSKRLPLVWDRLRAAMPTWRRLLPETVDPRAVVGDDREWVFKPALGRVGADVAVHGAVTDKQWATLVRSARRHHRHWIAQRRFRSVALADGAHACIGVFVVDGVTAGAYGRWAEQPLIDHRARETAVLIADDEEDP